MNFKKTTIIDNILLSFPNGDDVIEIRFDSKIRQAAVDENLGIVLVILENESGQKLVALNSDGTERFSVPPPKDWNFYYLSTHINHALAVVCVSPKERFDWFFSIDPNTGVLQSLNRAY